MKPTPSASSQAAAATPGAIQEALRRALEQHAGRRALVCGPVEVGYRELGRRIDDAAEKLHALLGSEPRALGFCLKNSIEYVILYFGALEAGHLPLLLDVNFNHGEIEAIRDDCGVDAMVMERRKAGGLELARDGEPGELSGEVVLLRLARSGKSPHTPRPDTRVCRFTSGTTGRPKCIEFSGSAVLAAARNWVAGTGMTAEDRTFCLAALSNGLAFNTSLLATFLAGAELHFHRGLPLTRAVARQIAEHRITRLVAFPALYRNFVEPGGPERADMASLRQAISAGAPLLPEVRRAFRERFGLDISDYYGIAETGPCTFETETDYHRGLGTPLPGVELAIAGHGEEEAVGEVLVRTESMASGYLNVPGMFEARVDERGFYRSGDHGKLLDGRLHLVGRTEDHINVGGRKVDPTEITAVVLDLDGVRDAVTFADEDLNRETVAHLVLVAPDLDRAAVTRVCRARLAPYKVPGRLSFVDEIPRNGIGKPRIAELRQRLRLEPETKALREELGQTVRKEAPR